TGCKQQYLNSFKWFPQDKQSCTHAATHSDRLLQLNSPLFYKEKLNSLIDEPSIILISFN
ncbi:hypothetical protein LDJ78_24950, partial [Citrobacter portucalensis]|nr:hypothetical protein [Citrobacter portucalensis]